MFQSKDEVRVFIVRYQGAIRSGNMGSFYTDVESMLHAVNTSMYIPASVLFPRYS